MCGICGFVEPSGRRAPASLVRAMADALAHRGPDGDGVWTDEEAGVAFGHRRLAIVDLSPLGRQPMESADGRLVLTFNGEIYNYRDLRAELEAGGIRLRGQSDTEVLVEACAAWGVGPTVRRLIGIFAFALWDKAARRLTLVRDQLGVKPLYWGRTGSGAGAGEGVMFASELKALRVHPGWSPELDRGALASYLRFSYVPAPHTIYRGVAKLPAGSMLTWEPGTEPRTERYWDMRAIARVPPRERDPASAIDALEALLGDAVGRQMVADVPLGAFLSGGIDSSTVAALMQARSGRPVRTFSIGFDAAGYDEAVHAKAVAGHLGTDHAELYVGRDHARDVIPRLPDLFDEPFADSSQIPTYLVSEMTRRHVTVALSGDGGDELFAGYHRYLWADAARRRLDRLPRSLRGVAAAALSGPSESAWDRGFGLLPRAFRPDRAGDRLHKLAALLAASGPDEVYRGLLSHWDPAEIVRGADEPRGILWDGSVAGEIPDFLRRMQFLDTVTYLPDDILAKVDRASMAVGLEARVPLLDHRVVEFAAGLPASLKVRDGQGKWLLRQVLYRHVPRELVERPKMGFSVPLGDWLRGPLRDWAEDLLDGRRLDEDVVLDPGPVRRRWAEHLSGTHDHGDRLWGVLMFQAWRRRWLGPGSDRAGEADPAPRPHRAAVG
ncbi:asparagine synthase (glutamine-hydrolyzing) [Skermanella rosea]|uniref:asparagine synthase (glutamine-hydrolyzing) n=1 Tax=Skermanella rosea TaxID=1817965 RepID=UPI001933EA93|nr:asparagine synthase (glutamine-hydrolyzing) [Skermanella rosea]UEM04412.1 asparagine synthase (glutamine-hydrolyzing) [Skermanella rosea]